MLTETSDHHADQQQDMASQAIWSVPIATAVAYLPVFVRKAIVAVKGKLNNKRPRDEDLHLSGMPKDLQELAMRLKNCHLNQLETLGLYAAAVAIGVAVRVPPQTLNRLTGYYIKSRVAYSFAYAAPQVGNGIVRTLTFLGSLASIMMLCAAAAETASSDQQ